MNPPFRPLPKYGPELGAIDAVVAAVSHDPSERDRTAFQTPASLQRRNRR